jgi:small subunit ribosomal protein S5
MSVALPAARCLLSRRFAAAAVRPAAAAATAPRCQATFHSSAPLEARRRRRFANIRADEMGLTDSGAVEKYSQENFKPYTPEELDVLKRHYTPEQMEALEAGEASIDPNDLTIQGRIRTDPYKLPYLDDFSRLVPTIDRKPKIHSLPNTNARFMNEDEFAHDFGKNLNDDKIRPILKWSNIPEEQWASMSPEGKKEIKEALGKLLHEQNAQIDSDGIGAIQNLFEKSTLTDDNAPTNSAIAPGLGKDIPGVTGMYKNPIDPEDNGMDDDGIYQDLKRRTGMGVSEMLTLTVKVLVIRLVHNQTRLGKIRSSWVLAIAGNNNGRLGIGEAKSVEHSVAVLKAKLLAIRNMQPIRRYEERTIYGSVDGKFGATVVKLHSRPPGKPMQRTAATAGYTCTNDIFRIRSSGAIPIVRDVPRLRHPRHGFEDATL